MKRYLLIIAAAIGIALASSCSKEPAKQDNPGLPKISNELIITANTSSTRTELGAGNSVLWVNDDVLYVFDQDGTGVAFDMVSNNGSSASFETSEWTGKTPVYASSSQAGNDAACNASGVFTVKLSPEQSIHAANTYGKNASASVGKITDNVGTYTIDEMKNVSGLLKFSLKSNEVASIVISAVGSETMAGFVDVDYAKVAADNANFWTETPAKSHSSSITLTPSDDALENNAFKAGSYYVSLLPQTYASGLLFTLKNKSGDTIGTQTIGATGGVTITRSKIKETEGFLDSIDMLPASFTVDIVFDDKPFGDYPAQGDQDPATGEEYVYNYPYTYMGMDKTEPLTFTIGRGYHKTSEVYDGYYRYLLIDYASPAKGKYAMRFNKAWGWVLTPAIAGRTLKSVTVSIASTGTKQWKVRSLVNGGDLSDYSAAATTTELNTHTVSFVKGDVAPFTSYYVWFGSQNTDVVSISLEYAKELPES